MGHIWCYYQVVCSLPQWQGRSDHQGMEEEDQWTYWLDACVKSQSCNHNLNQIMKEQNNKRVTFLCLNAIFERIKVCGNYQISVTQWSTVLYISSVVNKPTTQLSKGTRTKKENQQRIWRTCHMCHNVYIVPFVLISINVMSQLTLVWKINTENQEWDFVC